MAGRLTQAGYSDVRIKRSFLGKVIVAARVKGLYREVVLDPRNGAVVSDTIFRERAAQNAAQVSEPSGAGQSRRSGAEASDKAAQTARPKRGGSGPGGLTSQPLDDTDVSASIEDDLDDIDLPEDDLESWSDDDDTGFDGAFGGPDDGAEATEGGNSGRGPGGHDDRGHGQGRDNGDGRDRGGHMDRERSGIEKGWADGERVSRLHG